MDLGADEDEKPIGELFGRLIDDGKAYARAEAELAKARVSCEAERARKPLLFGAIAGGLAFAALLALTVTLVLSAAALVGPLVGGLIVTAVIAGLAWLFASLAQSSWKKRP